MPRSRSLLAGEDVEEKPGRRRVYTSPHLVTYCELCRIRSRQTLRRSRDRSKAQIDNDKLMGTEDALDRVKSRWTELT